MIRIHFFVFFIFLCLSANGQLSEDFSDGNLTLDPVWSGDLANFVVNDDFQLQLMAPEAGESYLSTPYSGYDSLQWDLDLILEMSPSNSNATKIYLAIDNSNPNLANGYFLQIGETGSDDAINFYRLDAGSETLIASASMGSVANDPAQARVQLIKDADGMWQLKADYNVGNVLITETEFFDDTYDLNTNLFFGIHCVYTSTRVDKFFYDNINIQEITPDTESPIAASATLIDANTVEVLFSELVESTQAENTSTYSVNNGIGNPSNATFDVVMPNKVILSFTNPLPGSVENTLTVSPVSDLFGNFSAEAMFPLFLYELPQAGDLIINEILADPNSGGADFVELYNNSDRFIQLQGLLISNLSKSESDEILADIILLPGEYLAITDDRDDILDNYEIMSSDRVIQNNIPSFNIESGNVSVQIDDNGLITTLDSFDYHEDFHYVLLDDSKGFSLERLSFNVDTNNSENWHSAASVVGGATPGYQNSNIIIAGMPEDVIDIPNRVFSPDGDNNEDFLVINYEIDQPGYLLNMKIFDDKGRLERELYRNELLSTNGFVKWDGTNDLGAISRFGVYIVWIELFNPTGDVSHYKKTCIVAEKLN